MRRRRILILLLILLAGRGFAAERPDLPGLYRQGYGFQQQGDYYRAIEIYLTLLDHNPDYRDPIIGLGTSYFHLQEYETALEYTQRALLLDRTDWELRNLKGRILVALGRMEEAEELFLQVLQHEPHNLNARFGLAELDIAQGRVVKAAGSYRRALAVSPENRKALLSLVLLYDYRGDYPLSEEYLLQALALYPENPEVHYIAAGHFFRSGRLEMAVDHVETALYWNPGFAEASILLSEIYLSSGRYAEVIPVIEPVLNRNQQNSLLWYTLGLAHARSGEPEKAIRAFQKAYTVRPDDALSRIAMENILIENPRRWGAERKNAVAYHFRQGADFEERNMLEKAFSEYRRGLLIDPLSREGRLRQASIYKRWDYPLKYLGVLDFLVAEGMGDQDIRDEIEIRRSMIADSLEARWGVEQFGLQRKKYPLTLIIREGRMAHYRGGEILAPYFEQLLLGYENVRVSSVNLNLSYAEAFRQARSDESDFFMVLNLHESERVAAMDLKMYHTETGKLIDELQLVRTGNDKIPEICRKAAEQIVQRLPLQGRILNRRFKEGLVDLGAVDGVEPEQEYLIIRKGALDLASKGFFHSYTASDVLGRFIVTESEELISQGLIEPSHYFDLINPGDYIIALPGGEEEAGEPAEEPAGEPAGKPGDLPEDEAVKVPSFAARELYSAVKGLE